MPPASQIKSDESDPNRYARKNGKMNVEKVINVEIISSESCAVRFGEGAFERDAVEVIKKIKGSRYEKGAKEWIVPREMIEKLHSDLK